MATLPLPRSLPLWAQQAVVAYFAKGGKVTVGKPCLSKYEPAPPCPTYLQLPY